MFDPEAKSVWTDFWKMKNVYGKGKPVSLVPNSRRKRKLDKILSSIRRK